MSREKRKGAEFERSFARTLSGAKRTPLSGAAGGGDVSFDAGALWSDFSWELKRRATLPKSLTGWLQQAATDIAIGDRRKPALAMREDRGRTIVAFYWDDLSTFVEALAETANANALLSLIRQLERDVESLKRAVR